jgi:hypothetical protein
MISQTWKRKSVHSHGVKMATELHRPEGRAGWIALVPEGPGICHITSLHVECKTLHRYHKNIHFILVGHFSRTFGKAFSVKMRGMKIELELHFASLLDSEH